MFDQLQSPVPAQRVFSEAGGRTAQYDAGDPFYGTAIPQALQASHFEPAFINSPTPTGLSESADSINASTPRSQSIPWSTPQTAPFQEMPLDSQISPELLEKLRRFDIGDATFHILDSIDPTFWSLETYIHTCSRISTESKDTLPLSYYASLICHVKDEAPFGKLSSGQDVATSPQDYYYDKTLLLKFPLKVSLMLREALQSVQRWIYDHEANSINSDTSSAETTSPKRASDTDNQDQLTREHQSLLLQDLKTTISKFMFILDQIDRNSGDAECFQASNWPSGTSIMKFVKHFGEFESLVPMRNTSDKARYCLDVFLTQLEGLMGQKVLPFESTYFYNDPAIAATNGQPWWMLILQMKVEEWKKQQEATRGSPRKRSFTVMDDYVIGHFRRPSDAIRGRPKKVRRPTQ